MPKKKKGKPKKGLLSSKKSKPKKGYSYISRGK